MLPNLLFAYKARARTGTHNYAPPRINIAVAASLITKQKTLLLRGEPGNQLSGLHSREEPERPPPGLGSNE